MIGVNGVNGVGLEGFLVVVRFEVSPHKLLEECGGGRLVTSEK